MGRKVVLGMAIIASVVVSAGLAGGQVGGGFLWWGNHEPIYIYGDTDFTVANGVMSGSGTVEDPYVIEGWRIEAPDADYGIYVDHTTRHFIVRDCVIERARIAGVYLNSVVNGRIESTQIVLSDTAIYLLNARENQMEGNLIAECRYGVFMAADSRDNLIVRNSFLDNGLSGYDAQRRNRWFDASGGNYWSDYDGVDRNGDGFGDEPYYPLWDSRPLMSAPAERTDVETAGPTYAGNLVAPDGSLVVTSQTPIALQSKDPGSGLAEIRYAIDGGEWTTYSGPIYLSGDDGPRKLQYYGIDYLGNEEPRKNVSFLLDNHSPRTVMEVGEPKYVDDRGTWVTSATPISLRRTQESTYGRTRTYYRIDGGNWRIYSGPFALTLSDGPHQIDFYSQNASGVAETPQKAVLYKDDAPPSSRGAQASAPSSLAVTVGPSPAVAAPALVTFVAPASAVVAPAEESPPPEEAPVVIAVAAVQTPSESVSEPAAEEPQTSSEVVSF